METYNRVRQLANEHRLSIAEVERRAKLAPQTIGNWRRVNPSGEALGKVATVFNTTVDYLLGRTDNRMAITSDKTVDISDSTIELSFKNHILTDRQRSDLSVYIKTMLETNYW
ncbi:MULTISPECIES: helix-turn-helix domain-containing protein [Leuconostoc]|uniref:Toxin-antitoxin system, antitoxin component, Xre family n=1 Tax=Leuconostoc mesenteroides subsp. cremoris ATCC 19254 TaxID=586220 RepID=C2KJD4_LEUMC|nr:MULTISPECIES: helix-turn-helix transcriptional regulator [Leuconostoc]EEJ42671.1 toxin-antitoxin system, antitoxin component, Xre family [Leuconostoc mesenteroides subsp. cremoris ATCC 19254]MDG9745622.1 helix-turn-helix transcriptional regulator [Leuconostoc falkenbergense]MDG9749581.1 helix-turn-helix transcriptional regulator [Leuconostoc mesenteroides]GEP15682.1 transcriptional regulator [Leuconostoc mesenteroides subsp. cremoris]